jgi:hypothetical protein
VVDAPVLHYPECEGKPIFFAAGKEEFLMIIRHLDEFVYPDHVRDRSVKTTPFAGTMGREGRL